MSDLRFRALTRIPYAQAVLALTRYARTSGQDFVFGPLSVSALENNGLTVSGEQQVLDALADFLSTEVPGLYAAEGLGSGLWQPSRLAWGGFLAPSQE